MKITPSQSQKCRVKLWSPPQQTTTIVVHSEGVNVPESSIPDFVAGSPERLGYISPYVVKELRDRTSEDEEPEGEVDPSELTGVRGPRRKAWKKLETSVPQMRIKDGVERERTIEEKLDVCKDIDEFNEIFHNDVASRVYDGFNTGGTTEQHLTRSNRILLTLITRNNAHLSKLQAEKESKSEAQKAIEQLTQEVGTLRTELEETEKELDELKMNHQELRIKTSADAEKINQLTRRAQELEDDLKDSRKECSDEKVKVGNLEADKNNLLKEVNELRAQNTSRDKEIEELKKKLSEAVAAVEEWRQDYKSLEKTNKVLEASIQQAEDDKTEFMENLPEEKAGYLAKFLRSNAFAKVSVFVNKANIKKFIYRTLQRVGAIKNFTPEEFGLRDSPPGILDVSSGEWDEESDTFIVNGVVVGPISFPELTFRDPVESSSGSQGGTPIRTQQTPGKSPLN